MSYIVPVFNQAPRYEDVRGSGGITPHIHNFGTRWRWVASFTPRPPSAGGKSPRDGFGTSLRPCRRRQYVILKRGWELTGLYGVTSQKISTLTAISSTKLWTNYKQYKEKWDFDVYTALTVRSVIFSRVPRSAFVQPSKCALYRNGVQLNLVSPAGQGTLKYSSCVKAVTDLWPFVTVRERDSQVNCYQGNAIVVSGVLEDNCLVGYVAC
jgi:hypothetical protein